MTPINKKFEKLFLDCCTKHDTRFSLNGVHVSAPRASGIEGDTDQYVDVCAANTEILIRRTLRLAGDASEHQPCILEQKAFSARMICGGCISMEGLRRDEMIDGQFPQYAGCIPPAGGDGGFVIAMDKKETYLYWRGPSSIGVATEYLDVAAKMAVLLNAPMEFPMEGTVHRPGPYHWHGADPYGLDVDIVIMPAHKK